MELLHGVGNEHRHADVDAVAAEDAGEALRHDEGDLRLLEGDGGLLAGRAAAEVASGYENAAGLAVELEVLRREAGHGVLADLLVGLAHRVAGEDLVGIDVVAENDNFTSDLFHLCLHLRNGDDAREGGGRRGSRARQIDLADLAAHTAGEVAVRRGNAHIARGDKSLVRAEAGTAAGVENGGAGVADDLRPAALFHLAEDLAGGGNDEHVDVGADLLAFKCLGDLLHVVQTAVGAAADDDLRDLDAGLLAHRNNVRGAEGAGDLRFKRGKIDLIGLEAVGFLLFGAEDGDHAADLDTHVADGHALGDGEIVDAGAGEKKAAVHEIVGAELAAEIQDEILAENRRLLHCHLSSIRGRISLHLSEYSVSKCQSTCLLLLLRLNPHHRQHLHKRHPLIVYRL